MSQTLFIIIQRPERQHIHSIKLIDPPCQVVITVSGFVPYFDHAITALIIFPQSYSMPTDTVRSVFHLTRVHVSCAYARRAAELL